LQSIFSDRWQHSNNCFASVAKKQLPCIEGEEDESKAPFERAPAGSGFSTVVLL
jgi:hypothetical protein